MTQQIHNYETLPDVAKLLLILLKHAPETDTHKSNTYDEHRSLRLLAQLTDTAGGGGHPFSAIPSFSIV